MRGCICPRETQRCLIHTAASEGQRGAHKHTCAFNAPAKPHPIIHYSPPELKTAVGLTASPTPTDPGPGTQIHCVGPLLEGREAGGIRSQDCMVQSDISLQFPESHTAAEQRTMKVQVVTFLTATAASHDRQAPKSSQPFCSELPRLPNTP